MNASPVIPADVATRYLHGRMQADDLRRQDRVYVEDYAERYCIPFDLPTDDIVDRIFTKGVEFIPVLPNHVWAFVEGRVDLICRNNVPKPPHFLETAGMTPSYPFPRERFPEVPRDTYSPEPPESATNAGPVAGPAEPEGSRSTDAAGNTNKGDAPVEEGQKPPITWLENMLIDFEAKRKVMEDDLDTLVDQARDLSSDVMELLGKIGEEREDTMRLIDAVRTVCGEDIINSIKNDVRKTLSFDINFRRGTKGDVKPVLHAPAPDEEVDPDAGTLRKSRFSRHRQMLGKSGEIPFLWTEGDTQYQKTLLPKPKPAPEKLALVAANSTPVTFGTTTGSSVAESHSLTRERAIVWTEIRGAKRPRTDDDDSDDGGLGSTYEATARARPSSPASSTSSSHKRARRDLEQQHDASPYFPVGCASQMRDYMEAQRAALVARSSKQGADPSALTAEVQDAGASDNKTCQRHGSEPEVAQMLLSEDEDQTDERASTENPRRSTDDTVNPTTSRYSVGNPFLIPMPVYPPGIWDAVQSSPSEQQPSTSQTIGIEPSAPAPALLPAPAPQHVSSRSNSPSPSPPRRPPKPLTRSFTRVRINSKTGELEEFDFRDTKEYQELGEVAQDIMNKSMLRTFTLMRSTSGAGITFDDWNSVAGSASGGQSGSGSASNRGPGQPSVKEVGSTIPF